LKRVIPERILNDKLNYERSPEIMTEYLKFTDLLDPSKATLSRTYDELDYESSSEELLRTLNESLENYNVGT